MQLKRSKQLTFLIPFAYFFGIFVIALALYLLAFKSHKYNGLLPVSLVMLFIGFLILVAVYLTDGHEKEHLRELEEAHGHEHESGGHHDHSHGH